jgi:hypothetical protein
MNTKKAIENLYLTFAQYSTSDMYYCKCGCIDPDDVKKLAFKKLRELEQDDFCSYHGSALYTWGDVEHYKHFLPRILEVHNQLNGRGIIGIYEIANKLDYAEWDTWNEEEIKAIKDFVFIDWNDHINLKYSYISTSDLESYSFFFNPNDLISAWKIDQNGLKNFVHFLYDNNAAIFDKGLKLNGKVHDNLFRELLQRKELLNKLEEEFFRVSEGDKSYGDKVSVVIQILEQEKAFNKN